MLCYKILTLMYRSKQPGFVPGCDVCVENALILEYPGVAPGLVKPDFGFVGFIPLRIGFDDGIVSMFVPNHQVGRGCQANALILAVFGPIRSGVKHIPDTGMLNNATGPGGAVIPSVFIGRWG